MDSRTVPVTVSVPPECPLLFSKLDPVREACTWPDWALRDVFWPVRPWIPRLVHPMPVEGDVIPCMVVSPDDDRITLLGSYCRSRVLPVHR